jgi:predicted metal-dependent hydrolase
MNHGSSLLGSAEASQLQESLGEAHRGLERNQDALAELEKQVCVILIRQQQIPMS